MAGDPFMDKPFVVLVSEDRLPMLTAANKVVAIPQMVEIRHPITWQAGL